MLGSLLLIFRVPAPEEQSAMHFRVQRLHASAQHFRPAGEIGNIAHRYARFAQQFGGPARRENFDLQRGEPLRKFHDPRLVENADQRALHPHDFLQDN